jgi:hypothetical protein
VGEKFALAIAVIEAELSKEAATLRDMRRLQDSLATMTIYPSDAQRGYEGRISELQGAINTLRAAGRAE